MLRKLLFATIVLTGCWSSDPPPDDDLWIVNTQEYRYGELDPALFAYRAVARHEGWTEADIEAWLPFVIDIIAKESGGCPAVRGGTLYNAIGDDCNKPHRWGRKSDTGFGQVTPVLYRGKNALLCKHAQLCTWQAIAGTPWNSMRALVITVEHLGSQPWCYNAYARRYHDCSLAP
jgi:hypothetical protein